MPSIHPETGSQPNQIPNTRERRGPRTIEGIQIPAIEIVIGK